MTFSEIKKEEGRISGLVALERVLPYSLRSKSKEFLLLVAPFAMVALLAFKESLHMALGFLYGIMFLVIALWLVIFMLDAFYNSHYFEGTRFTIPEWGVEQNSAVIPFEVLEIVSHTHSGDLTGGFLESKVGRATMFRLNVSPEKVRQFILGDRSRVYADSITFADPVNFLSYASAVFSADVSFSKFLTSQDITRGDYEEVAQWVGSMYEHKKEAYRWWGRDALGRIRSIGKNWSRGKTEILERYGIFVHAENHEPLFKKEIDELEIELTRTANSHVLLIANEYRKLLAVTAGLAYRIQGGTVLPAIEHKKLFILDATVVSQAAVVEGQFESIIVQLLNEAVNVSHLILVIKDFSRFVLEAKKHGVSVEEMLRPYSQVLPVVAFTEQSQYHTVLAQEKWVLDSFKKIFIESEKLNIIIRSLEGRAFEFERRYKIFFSYQALVAIAEIASLKFPDTDAEHKALEIFRKIGPRLVVGRIKKVTVQNIREFT